jgi:hypothetical protein
MLRLRILAVALVIGIALLIDSGVTAAAEVSGCTQASTLPTARVRWAAVRNNHVDPAHNDDSCRSYGTNFLEVVTVRASCVLLQRWQRPGTDSRIARLRDRGF